MCPSFVVSFYPANTSPLFPHSLHHSLPIFTFINFLNHTILVSLRIFDFSVLPRYGKNEAIPLIHHLSLRFFVLVRVILPMNANKHTHFKKFSSTSASPSPSPYCNDFPYFCFLMTLIYILHYLRFLFETAVVGELLFWSHDFYVPGTSSLLAVCPSSQLLLHFIQKNVFQKKVAFILPGNIFFLKLLSNFCDIAIWPLIILNIFFSVLPFNAFL